jgi:16S rRNA (cytidine1402-2'-O)-methyltransferase
MTAMRPEGAIGPGLYLVATPIGNTGDLTTRALAILKAADIVAAEDTRMTAKLLSLFGTSRALTPYNDHNGATARPHLIARLKAGASVALASDAGTPLVSDPGYKLVREAIAEGVPVYAVPGASAALAALSVSGLPSDRFLFAGFLPAKQGERKAALSGLAGIAATLIFFEAPHRLAETLADMADVLGPRPASIGRELTKLHEDVVRGLLDHLAERYAKAPMPKGEITITVGPPREAVGDMARADTLLTKALEHMPLSAAASLIAEALNLPRRDVYALGLEKKKAGE